jgi:hypothetical protein
MAQTFFALPSSPNKNLGSALGQDCTLALSVYMLAKKFWNQKLKLMLLLKLHKMFDFKRKFFVTVSQQRN